MNGGEEGKIMELSLDRQPGHSGALPPGPSNRFWGLENLYHFQGARLLTLAQRLACYGDAAYCKLGPFPLYFFNHPDSVREVLVEHADSFYKPRRQKEVIGQVIRDGTFNADGPYWKQQRRLVQPAFHAKRIEAYADIMVNETSALLESWDLGQTAREVDLYQEMLKVTMAIIAQALFGAEIKGQAAAISHALKVCMDTETRQMQSLIRVPQWVPTPRHLEFGQAIKFFDQLIYGFIHERRQSQEDRGDLLSMLLLAADEAHTMSDNEVRDEALTLFSAGHETTANTLAWTWLLLSQHPEVERKLAEEVRRVLGQRSPGLADLSKLPYVEMVIKEALRLHPPAYALVRETIQEVTIGGYRIPVGNIVMVSQHVLHRDPRFFEQPDKFMPERFAADTPNPFPRYAYFPFGAGPRICTGQALAMMEAQIILTMIVQHCSVRVDLDQDVRPNVVLLQRPGHGLRATIAARPI
ncbi:MAG TPA: cytochrome P450 [Aggregatilineales bacterium]|nr:cytochrome P450 [Aggregatilineales bacterium]